MVQFAIGLDPFSSVFAECGLGSPCQWHHWAVCDKSRLLGGSLLALKSQPLGTWPGNLSFNKLPR